MSADAELVDGAWEQMKAQAAGDPLLYAAMVTNAEVHAALLSPEGQASIGALAQRVAALWVMYERAPSRAGVPHDRSRLLGEPFWQLVAAARTAMYVDCARPKAKLKIIDGGSK